MFFRTRVRRVQGTQAPAGVQEQHPQAIFSCCFKALWGFKCVVKLPHKSQCKTHDICLGKSNHTLARCVFFYQYCYLSFHLIYGPKYIQYAVFLPCKNCHEFIAWGVFGRSTIFGCRSVHSEMHSKIQKIQK